MKKTPKLMFIVISVSLLLCSPVFSQYTGKGKMQGLVTDESGIPLGDVKVKLYNHNAQGGFETKTNKNGKWKAYWIRGGRWDLDFEKTGYETKRVSAAIRQVGGKPHEVNVKLKKLVGLVVSKDVMKDLDRGNELFSAKKYDEAIPIYEQILLDSPESFIINQNIGNCYFQKKEYEKAIKYYKKVIEKENKHIKCLISIGNSHNNKGDKKKAIEWYQKIDISKIDDNIVLYNIGIFYFNSGDSTKAIEYLKQSVKIKEDFLDGLYWLGMAYMNVNKNTQAVETYKKYIEFDNDSERSNQVKEILKALKSN